MALWVFCDGGNGLLCDHPSCVPLCLTCMLRGSAWSVDNGDQNFLGREA